jgi:two-component system, OmpR family, phosphate regulon response regulator PhoB
MSNILYAEDDRDCRELFAFALRQYKHVVHEARNGAQAVQIVREEPLDLVILDVRMPMMTGYDSARIIAKEHPDLPVVFLSAKGMRREVDLAYECGEMVVDYLIKPIAPDELVARVESVIEACQARGMEAVRAENMARELLVEW